MNRFYVSSGAFTGRINGRNPDLLFEAADKLNCDGFELMLFNDIYDYFPSKLDEYMNAGIKIDVIHADKSIGDHASLPDGENLMRELFVKNCKIAYYLRAKRLVTHCWGMPPSDEYTDMVYKRVGILSSIAKEYGIEFLCENCVCAKGSPLRHMQNLARLYPDIAFTVDTRCSEFHSELSETLNCEKLWQNNIKHLHINDYKGGYKDWNARYPIPQPTQGQIDWNVFFKAIKTVGFSGSVTLEAPAMLPDGINDTVLNRSLGFIKAGFGEE